jgi:hypothetical protein
MKRKVSAALKKEVAFEQGYKCSDCNKILPPSYQIDHILPFSISRDDSRANLTALCPNCHANKTQRECRRIIYYKKLISTCVNCNICYFCLEEYGLDDDHTCDKVCKPINLPKPKPVSTDSLFKFAFLPKNEEDIICQKIKKLKVSSNERKTLYIKLTRPYLIINHNLIELKDENLTPHDVGQAVRSVTDNIPTEQGKYTDVEFDIFVENKEGEGGEACIEYLSSLLPQEMPQGIFKVDADDVSYMYFAEDM